MFQTGFVNGKQKRVRRAEYITLDPLTLHQMEMWEDIPMDESEKWPVIDINTIR